MIIDINLETGGDGAVCCRHCGAQVGASPQQPMSQALVRTSAAANAGPGIKEDPALFTDRTMALRQSFCPGCLTALATEIVPADEPNYRKWALA
ncbi:hypothetical protein [Nocardia mexicana]|uniref:Uncharacterized protein n=1 Tax=Nocardia mexicana TaxID=279262 RepID=A0A370HFZ3_9NOCA|nr:hypothetical protein [Nocardia mexicana]RDI55935.1 hypothetical protein DFR68_101772 [Nocardia mexicana]